jgi:hypothetical protein
MITAPDRSSGRSAKAIRTLAAGSDAQRKVTTQSSQADVFCSLHSSQLMDTDSDATVSPPRFGGPQAGPDYHEAIMTKGCISHGPAPPYGGAYDPAG